MMRDIKLSIIGTNNDVKKERSASEHTYLDYLNAYEEGDIIKVSVDSENCFLMVQLDETLAPSLIYVKEREWCYQVPVDAEIRRSYSPKSFAGEKHYMWARYAALEEVERYHNLAFNPHDQKDTAGVYPHAEANVVTRGESTFSARNAIDGVIANTYHGNYPYESWGINRQKDAEITIFFGCAAQIDKAAVILRGDYPHDSYWTSGILEFSDGTQEVLKFTNALEYQYFPITKRTVEWVKLKELKKAEDDSPFPALTQFEVYGRLINE